MECWSTGLLGFPLFHHSITPSFPALVIQGSEADEPGRVICIRAGINAGQRVGALADLPALPNAVHSHEG